MNIDSFLKQNPKHKLVFTSVEQSEFEFIDIGHALAQALADQKYPSIVATTIFESLMIKSVRSHPVFGKYLAIKNIGILFEPELMLNLRMLFESIAHDMLLIVYSNGFIKDETYHFNKTAEGLDINLSGLSYLVIE